MFTDEDCQELVELARKAADGTLEDWEKSRLKFFRAKREAHRRSMLSLEEREEEDRVVEQERSVRNILKQI